MAVHTIEPNEHTLHGVFSREFPPVLSVEPGDTVRFRTLDAGWGLEPPTEVGVPRRKFEMEGERRGNGHALCGPVEVRGATPGSVLEVRIGELRPAGWGWTYAGGPHRELNSRLGVSERETLLRWALDQGSMTGSNQFGHTVALQPFMGVMGMPPAESGLHSTRPPRECGGNIDCKELVTGSTLYLPVEVEGALFSTGDGHAAQGDGEVCGQAIECPMDIVELTFQLRDDLRLSTPRADTPAGWLTFGFHRDLNTAMVLALDAMLDLMQERHGLQRPEALALASVVVDLRVTQVVNEVCGVHALVPHGVVS